MQDLPYLTTIEGRVIIVVPVQCDFCAGIQPRRNIVGQTDGTIHFVAVEGRVVVVERPESVAVNVLVRIAAELVHRAVRIFVSRAFDALPAARPTVKQTFLL